MGMYVVPKNAVRQFFADNSVAKIRGEYMYAAKDHKMVGCITPESVTVSAENAVMWEIYFVAEVKSGALVRAFFSRLGHGDEAPLAQAYYDAYLMNGDKLPGIYEVRRYTPEGDE